MGIPTLISTSTASDTASVAITSGIDGTYDEYMFVMTDINPATDSAEFTFQADVDGSTDYDLTMTTTAFFSYNQEDDGGAALAYRTAGDQAQGTAFQHIQIDVGNGADESAVAILHLFNPSSTTYVKHFYCRSQCYQSTSTSQEFYTAGYFNTTTAIDKIQFKFSAGNLDGVIQLYGIA